MDGQQSSAASTTTAGMSMHANMDPVLSSVSPAAGQVDSPISVRSLTPRSTHTAPPQYASSEAGGYGMLRSPGVTGGTYGSDNASLSYADLQGMDFLQELHQQQQFGLDPSGFGLSGGGGGVGDGGSLFGSLDGGQDMQMDVGLGMGWEGMHHDFSDGQQVDLFDGFFFGGQGGGG